MKRIYLLVLITLVCLSSCNEVYRYTSNTFFAMNTVVSTVVSEKIGEDGTIEILSELENRLSRTLPDSEISRLNNGEDVALSDETLGIVEKSLEIAKNTDYAFSPCMGALSDLWDITSGRNVVPSHDEIKEALTYCNADNVTVDDGRVILDRGMKIDLGGIAKGYALEKASESIRQMAASKNAEADFCISIGGNVSVGGSSENNRKNGKNGWNVGITNPFDKTQMITTVTLEEGYVSVSGAYERFFEKDGRIYHHIFDSRTGYPSDSGLESAVVVNNSGLEGDALSTALFVMGRDRAVEFYNKGIYEFEMLLVTDEKEIIVTDGLFQRMNEDLAKKNGFKVTVINKNR